MVLGRSRTVSGDGHTSARPNLGTLSHGAGWVSVIGVRKTCDEKGPAPDCGSGKARDLTRLEKRDVWHPAGNLTWRPQFMEIKIPALSQKPRQERGTLED